MSNSRTIYMPARTGTLTTQLVSPTAYGFTLVPCRDFVSAVCHTYLAPPKNKQKGPPIIGKAGKEKRW